jgi:hydrogenase nickel incorporation protein HypA/HybF
MHEWSIADNLVKLVVEAVEREGLASVSRVVIQVGVLRQVIPESLEMAFSFLTGETSVAGAVLEIEMVPLKALCRACGAEISEGEFVFICPACGGFDLNILTGKELYIDYIEGEK